MLYHGASPWSVPLSFGALFDVPEHLRPALDPHLVQFSYLIDDLSAISDDQLRARAMTALVKLAALSFKHARTRADLLDRMAGWGDLMRAVAGAAHGLEALALVMRYILLVNDHVTPEALYALVEHEVGPEAKDKIVTAGEQLIEQGRQQGIEQGRQQGSQQTKREVLLGLLRRRFGAAVDLDAERRLASASVAQIDAWFERVFSAATVTELLAD